MTRAPSGAQMATPHHGPGAADEEGSAWLTGQCSLPLQRQLLLRSIVHTPVGVKGVRGLCPDMFKPEGL